MTTHRNLSTEAIDRLNLLRHHFQEEPKRLNMLRWLHPPRVVKTVMAEHLQPTCQTVGCISAWAQIMFLQDDVEKTYSQAESWGTAFMVKRGAEALLIPEEAARLLFFTQHWPERYRFTYERLHGRLRTNPVHRHTPEEMAINLFILKELSNVTDDRMIHFIRTDGTDKYPEA